MYGYGGNHIVVVEPDSTQLSTATLMKTGQTTSYRTGDDGDLEAGRGASFLVLAENNPFGNTNRFTDELGGQTYTNNIVIDWGTYNGANVLGWYRLVNGGLTTWNQAIDGAIALNVGGFTGWKCPNTTQILSICQWWLPICLNYAPFNLDFSTYDSIWTSTTWEQATIFARAITASQLTYLQKVNSNNYRYIACRTFTVTGTTLS